MILAVAVALVLLIGFVCPDHDDADGWAIPVNRRSEAYAGSDVPLDTTRELR